MVTISSADAALKNYYLGVVADQLNTESNPLLARIKQTTAHVWGKDVRRLVREGINGGVGAGSEASELPQANGNGYAQLVTSLKNLYGTIEITDKAMRASASNEGAFVNLLNDEMEGLVRASSFNLGRMLYGDGSGILGTVTAVSGTTVTMSTVKNFAVGMTVDFLNEYGVVNTNAQGRRVNAVDRVNKKITLSGTTLTTVTLPIGSGCCVQGSYGFELTGLGAIFNLSKSNIYGLSRSAHSFLNPYVKTDIGAITEAEIQTAIDTVEETSGSKINFIVCSWGVKRALTNVLAERHSFVNTVELEGGFKGISFCGIPVIADRFCPDGTMYLLNTDDFALHQLCDWEWLADEDGCILKQVAGKPVYTATLVKYADLVCVRPCGQAMLSGITEA